MAPLATSSISETTVEPPRSCRGDRGRRRAAWCGCAYDYAQRSDRVAYSAGDAVKANLEMQTENPLKRSQRNTKGLGKNGVVIAPTIVPEE